jgi:hypothetical protein
MRTAVCGKAPRQHLWVVLLLDSACVKAVELKVTMPVPPLVPISCCCCFTWGGGVVGCAAQLLMWSLCVGVVWTACCFGCCLHTLGSETETIDTCGSH